MKKINIILLMTSLMIITSCGKEEIIPDNRFCIDAIYESEFETKLNDKVCFPDGNSIVVDDIQHQFCPCDVICTTAGYLYVKWITETSDNSNNKVIYTTTLFNDPSIFDNHEISLFTYSYLSEDGQVPACAEDFEAEKIVITMNITPL